MAIVWLDPAEKAKPLRDADVRISVSSRKDTECPRITFRFSKAVHALKFNNAVRCQIGFDVNELAGGIKSMTRIMLIPGAIGYTISKSTNTPILQLVASKIENVCPGFDVRKIAGEYRLRRMPGEDYWYIQLEPMKGDK